MDVPERLEPPAAVDPRVGDVLVANHRAFLAYLERRVGSREAAEDLLQEAFVRSAGRTADVPDDALVPWFYRVLRNAVVDRYRRRGAEDRALAAFARELDAAEAAPDELRGEICACIGRLAHTLKPEYRTALATVDVEGTPVKDFARQSGLSASNAGVRLFRARAALRKQVAVSCGTCADHGCLDCSCQHPPPGV